MRSVPVGRVFGVRLGLHWTVLVIFVLIVLQLRGEVLPSWHPDWSSAASWAVALSAAVVFLASILVHELAHAVVARAYGIRVRSVELFLLGGIANIERRPPHPRAEAAMAAVGPLASAVLGFTFIVISAWLSPDITAGDPMSAMARLGPVATLLAWVGPLNLVLAVFNMIPAFPLDGGRVFRALLWWATRDAVRATRIATAVSRAFALALIATGIAMAFGVEVPFFGVGLGSGLWLGLIGWFLYGVASLSYRELAVETMLAPIKVREIMLAEPMAVTPELTIGDLVDRFLQRTDDRALPVVTDGKLVGVVTTAGLRRFPRAEWPQRQVHEIMTPAADIDSLSPDDGVVEGLRRLGGQDILQLPVLDHRRLIGMLRRRDISRWIELHGDPDLARVA